MHMWSEVMLVKVFHDSKRWEFSPCIAVKNGEFQLANFYHLYQHSVSSLEALVPKGQLIYPIRLTNWIIISKDNQSKAVLISKNELV